MTHHVEFSLAGLGCAHCAGKIESAVQKLPQVKQAQLAFATQRLAVELAPEADAATFAKEVTALVQGIEPGVQVERIGGTAAATSPEAADDDDSDDHEHGGESQRLLWLRLGGALVLALLGRFSQGWLSLALYVAAYGLAGYDVLWRALRNIRKGQIFDENFLMALASVSALVLGDHAEAVAVMLFYQVGEAFQDRAVGNSRKSIAALLDIRPDTALLVEGESVREVKAEQVPVGAIVQVNPGSRVPLDGIVVEGHAALDTSALTGESLPREVGEGDEALSGCLSHDGRLRLRVTKAYGESTASKILDMVQHAAGRKARTERFITRFAKIYTPAVVLAAALLAVVPPLLVPGAVWSDWIHRGLTFLVVSCPCALVISVPLGYFGGIGAASRAGILCKGGDALDALCETDTLVMDKTGTLTQGVFAVQRQYPAPGVTEAELLLAAATAEQASSHPIAQSILRAAGETKLPPTENVREIAGCGVAAQAEGDELLVGNMRLMEQERIPGVTAVTGEAGSVVYVARTGKYLGALVVADALKPDARSAIEQLAAQGIRRTVMLTGDRAAVAQHVAGELGITEVHAELLPGQKMDQLERLLDEARGKVAFVGDGINDAPALARADVGIAMGGLGADAAIEAADIVLMDDQPTKLATALRIARRTRRIVTENIVFALAIKAVILVLSALGYANMWLAVFADVGVAILAVFNAMRTANVAR